MKRTQMLNRCFDSYDLVIIGGGITGAGAARDAAMRGLKTLLVDMNDLALERVQGHLNLFTAVFVIWKQQNFHRL